MLRSILLKYQYQLLLIVVVLLALYPLTFFIYVPKWDNINGYLPYRYFISDYLWNGHLPLWNPFQRLGYPGYSDLQSGVWNPIVWIIMLFGKYTINSLIVELLSCYVFAGLGFFKLSSYLFKSKKVGLILGVSYALSGFMVGSSQLMVFLIAVTWFPWIIYHLLKFFECYTLKHKLLSALFIALFITGASPAYTIVLVYIVIGIFIYQIATQKAFHKILIGGVTILIVLVVLILPYINSFIEFAPYFNRVDRLEYNKFLLSNPFTPVSYISFIFPYGVVAKTDWFNITDLSLRNGYFGIIGLISCACAFLSKWNRKKTILVVGVITSLMMAAGGETFIFEYLYHLPGFGIFRHPSMFRAFTIFCCLLLGGIEVKNLLENGITKNHKVVFSVILILITVGGVWAFTKTEISAVKQLVKDVYHYGEFSNSSLSTHVLLNAIVLIGLFVIMVLVKRLTKLSWFWAISIVVIFDFGIQTRLSIPTTVCYKISQDSMSQFFDELPNHINQNDNYKTLKELEAPQALKSTEGIWQNVATYNKTLCSIGTNPMRFKSFDEAKEDGKLESTKEHNIMYFENGSQRVDNIKVNYNKFSALINESDTERKLVLNQNFHHLWRANIDGEPIEIKEHNNLTMSVVLPKNKKGELIFEFKSPRTLPTFIISILGYLILILILLFNKSRITEYDSK